MQALIKGEVDFVEEHLGAAGAVAGGPRGHHRPERRLPELRRDRLQHRLGRPRDRGADRRPEPGRARPGVPVRAQLRARPRAAHPDRLPGRWQAGRRRSSRRPTPATSGRPTTRTPSPSTSTRRPSCSTRPATPSAPTASARCPTATRSARSGWRRAATRETSVDVMDFFKEWLGRARHRRRGRDLRVEQADRRHPRRRVRRLRVGLVRRARPRLDAQLHDLRPARATGRTRGTATRSTTRSTSSSTSRWTTRPAQDQVKQMQEILYRDAPYLVTAYSSIGEAFRSDRFALLPAAARPGRHPGSSSTAPRTTSTCGRPPRRATATASRPRVGAGGDGRPPRTAAATTTAWAPGP